MAKKIKLRLWDKTTIKSTIKYLGALKHAYKFNEKFKPSPHILNLLDHTADRLITDYLVLSKDSDYADQDLDPQDLLDAYGEWGNG